MAYLLDIVYCIDGIPCKINKHGRQKKRLKADDDQDVFEFEQKIV